MTPTQIETAIRERYNAVGDTFFNQNMVLDIIWQASQRFVEEVPTMIERKYTTTSVAGTRNYEFPTSTIAIRRVEYDGEKVYPVSIERDPKTSTTEVSGTPREYAIWNSEIIFFPTPSASSDTITIYSYNEPQQVENTSTLEIPSVYHMSMVDFGLSVFYAKDGNLAMAAYYRRLFDDAVARAKRTEAKRLNGDEFVVVQDQEDTGGILGLISG